jgi:MoaA/NifB/PqqE/SkfB family radical SAM enzyme
MSQNLSLITRGLQIARRNPAIISTVLRMEYRHRLGIPRDRRCRPGFSAPPTNLSINLTNRCNLKCVMCRGIRLGQEVPENRPWYSRARELALEDWIRLLDEAASFRPWLYVTGGEPLMYPQFRNFVTEAKKRHLVVHLQTNATLLAREAEFLVEMGVEAVNVSIDGPPAVHDRIRGLKGGFARVEAGMQALVAARRSRGRPNPILSINCTISKGNLEYLEEMVPLAIRLQADIMQLQHTMFDSPENVARQNRLFSPERSRALGLEVAHPSICEGEYYENELTAADLPQLHAALGRARQQAQGRLKLHFMPNLPDRFLSPYYLDLNYPFPQGCDDFWATGRILADGTFSPCLNLVVGNITEQPFLEMWNGPRMRQLRLLIAQGLFPGCVRCCHRHFTNASRAF